MIASFLLMMVAGIGVALAVSDPIQVTLRWLRLGGLVALSLLGVAATAYALVSSDDTVISWLGFALAVGFFIAQLVLVQIGHRPGQRLASLGGAVFAAYAAGWGLATAIVAARYHLGQIPTPSSSSVPLNSMLLALVSGGLTGGFLMAMLLGHAYLTAGGTMNQMPFQRLVLMLVVLLALRLAISFFGGLWPYWFDDLPSAHRPWNTIMIIARYLVGIVVPAVFLYMIYDCVQRRANQSATGILYVANVLIIIGEGTALMLMGATGYVF